jgi:hypothetical protein
METDAHLATLAITHGATLASCDTDFASLLCWTGSALRWPTWLNDRWRQIPGMARGAKGSHRIHSCAPCVYEEMGESRLSVRTSDLLKRTGLMTQPTKVVICGAAGRDFHNFNVVYRDDPQVEVVAFTATQIPGIESRRVPAELAGPGYPNG